MRIHRRKPARTSTTTWISPELPTKSADLAGEGTPCRRRPHTRRHLAARRRCSCGSKARERGGGHTDNCYERAAREERYLVWEFAYSEKIGTYNLMALSNESDTEDNLIARVWQKRKENCASMCESIMRLFGICLDHFNKPVVQSTVGHKNTA